MLPRVQCERPSGFSEAEWCRAMTGNLPLSSTGPADPIGSRTAFLHQVNNRQEVSTNRTLGTALLEP